MSSACAVIPAKRTCFQRSVAAASRFRNLIPAEPPSCLWRGGVKRRDCAAIPRRIATHQRRAARRRSSGTEGGAAQAANAGADSRVVVQMVGAPEEDLVAVAARQRGAKALGSVGQALSQLFPFSRGYRGPSLADPPTSLTLPLR